LRFLRAVRYRKAVVLTTVAAGLLLGGLYWATTPRMYQSDASLLILQAGEDTFSTRMTGERMAKDLMATYRNMVGSEVVIEKAVRALPVEARVDLNGIPEKEWPKQVAKGLTVRNVRGTNVLEIAYLSKDARAAAAMVDAVVTAYLDFMDAMHKSTAQELLQILTKEKAALEQQLRQRETDLIDVRSRAGELVLREGQEGVNVAVKRAMSLNQALITAHEKRLEAQSQLAAVEAAVRNREELPCYALTMLDHAGAEVLLQRLGLSNHDAMTVSRVIEQLLANRARLQSELEVFGPAHHRPRETQEHIRAAEQYLESRQAALRDRVQQLSHEELAPVLVQMARQQLEQTRAHEQALLASYEKEKEAAIGLDRTMAELEILELELKRLRGFHEVVLQRIKDIDLGRESGMIRTAILSRPQVPVRPVWPRLSVVGLESLVLGLLVG
jgi:uncharacterized protein involved in exopolysaccharide biosynthesis